MVKENDNEKIQRDPDRYIAYHDAWNADCLWKQ